MRRYAVVTVLFALFASRSFGQGSNASLTGFIQDSSKAFIAGVRVLAINTATDQQFATATNKDGSYNITSLPVGPYRMQIEKAGFQTILKEDLFLHTQDVLQINFQMAVGSTSESITVSGDSVNINTTDATVSTVIDRKFVEEMPLNGRSFQTLVLLSPGVTTSTPQGNALGEFSVNGLRTNSNNYMVDGASASNPASFNSAAGSAGMAPSETALGTTQSMIPVDALEEFRVATSTYSAEYGRQPGAQVSFRSRSGTNEYHGSAYDYLRNSAFDANNWFNEYVTPALPTPQERQNDFGLTLGGPISAPRLYSGRNRAFFFFSYEGLRLNQPQPASIFYVPSNGTYNTATYSNPLYKNLRANAPAALQPALNAWPMPNCSTKQDPQCVDYGTGVSPYIQTPPSTATINSINARIDYQLRPSMRVFARYSDTTSNAMSYNTNGPDISTTYLRNRVYLLAADNTFGSTISNEIRLQYAPAYYYKPETPSQANGASAVNLNTLQGLPVVGGETWIEFLMPDKSIMYQQSYGSKQFQPNATETVSWMHGTHLFKAGVDYRQTTAYYGDGYLSRGPYATYQFTNANQILTDTPNQTTGTTYLRVDPTTKNLGLFVQDQWRVHPRLSLSLGLRWDLNPPPSVSGAQMYTYTGDVNNPSSLGLSSLGAPLYRTVYTDFGPRVGVAATLRDRPHHELVFRTGGGIFYDTVSLSQTFGAGYGLGSARTATYTGTSQNHFPLPANDIVLPVINPPQPPYTFTYYPDPHLVPPSAVQWSASLEQALGEKQSLIVGYVASLGRQLSTLREYSLHALNPLFNTIYQYENGPGSSYNSLQVQYRRQALRGLQVQAAYTWAHAIDSASTDYYSADLPLEKGNADNDLRHNFTSALVYNLPTQYARGWERAILGHWNADLLFVARSAFPFEQLGPAITDAATGQTSYEPLNYNGKNPYVYNPAIPGGRQIDPTIFSVPTAGQKGNGDAPRNFLRGFGEAQANIAIERSFALHEQVQLQFRAEAFNIANHPNFGSINATCGASASGATCTNVLMGQATSTLSSSLNGLSPLYQQGGPRSLQFMLKLRF